MPDALERMRDSEPETAACRHCGCTIERIHAGWVNTAGFFACVKGGLPGSGRGPVLHEPMPVSLRGAPEPAMEAARFPLDVPAEQVGYEASAFARRAAEERW